MLLYIFGEFRTEYMSLKDNALNVPPRQGKAMQHWEFQKEEVKMFNWKVLSNNMVKLLIFFKMATQKSCSKNWGQQHKNIISL